MPTGSEMVPCLLASNKKRYVPETGIVAATHYDALLLIDGQTPDGASMATDGHLNRLASLTAQEVDLTVQTAKCYQFPTIRVHGCRITGLFSAATQAVLVGVSLLLHYRVIV